MTFACLASLAIFASGLAAWSTVMWYKGRGPRDRKRVKKLAEEKPKEALAEQLA